MDGTKLARKRTCAACPHWANRHADVWRWPHCDCDGVDVEVDDAFLDGPETNCPAGQWLGLEPVDMEAERMEGEERLLDAERRNMKPLLDLALAGIPDDGAKGAFLVDAVARGMVSQVVAKEAAQEGGIDLDAELA